MAMTPSYRFGRFEVLPVERRVRDAEGRCIAVGGRAFDVMLALIEHPHRTVTKHELLEAAWPGLVVEEANVQVQVSALRRLLGSDVIATDTGRGYRWSAVVSSDGPAPGPPILDPADGRRIAVLAFRSDVESDHGPGLAGGLAHDLLAEMSRNVDLHVISHHSSFRYDGVSSPLSTVARQLRTRYVVDGSIGKSRGRLELRIGLHDAVEERLVWSSDFALHDADLAVTRMTIVQKIAGSLHVRAQETEIKRLLVRSASSLDACGMVWRALALLIRFSADATREARSLLEQATRLVPDDASAWGCLSHLNALDAIMRITGDWHPGRSAEFLAQGRRALEIDSDNVSACRAMSVAHRAIGAFDAALEAAKRGVRLAPSSAHNLQTLAEVECAIGRSDVALAVIERALALHPFPPAWVHAIHAAALWSGGRVDDAAGAATEGLACLPQYWPARIFRLYAFHEAGRLDEARDDASLLMQQLPRLSASGLFNYWHPGATTIRARVHAAAVASGIPRGRA